MSDKTATLLIDNLPGFNGHAALYRCEPPIEDYSWDDEKKPEKRALVVASTAYALGRPETYLFPANEAGEITSWVELPGSRKDITSHEEVFSLAGYFFVRAE